MLWLETNLDEMRSVDADSIRVAILGVVLPLLLGFLSVRALLPDLPLDSILFVSALVAAIAIGPATVRVLAKLMSRLDIVEAKMFTSYLFVMVLAWMADLSGLATIIGAFAAGIVLHDGFFKNRSESSGGRVVTIRELIMPPLLKAAVGRQSRRQATLCTAKSTSRVKSI